MSVKDSPFDAYSGMWWIRADVLTQSWTSINGHGNAESASHRLFNLHGPSRVVMTRDWLDFCVEHLSHYFRDVNIQSDANFGVVRDKQLDYMQGVHDMFPNAKESAFHETLAMFPYYSDGTLHLEQFNGEGVPRVQDRKKYLYALSMASTLTSLWTVGIRRVVVVGNLVVEPPEVALAVDIFRQSTPASSSSMEVVCVPLYSTNTTGLEIPLDVVDMAYQVFRNDTNLTESERSRWLGATPDQWKYLYFSEADLILHTRPGALHGLTQSVKDGNLVAAHRFQLMQHKDDFPDDNNHKKYIPKYGSFYGFLDLNARNGDSCCDAGNRWPGLAEYEGCGNWWYGCGYHEATHNTTIAESHERHHKRLKHYPMIRLMDGMRTLVIQEHGRLCHPAPPGTEC